MSQLNLEKELKWENVKKKLKYFNSRQKRNNNEKKLVCLKLHRIKSTIWESLVIETIEDEEILDLWVAKA